MTNSDITLLERFLERFKLSGGNVQSIPVAIYARKSTEDESEMSLQGQIDSCKEYISCDKRLNVVKTYSEDNVSGYNNTNRKQLQQMLEDAKKGLFNIVVVYSLNRLGRHAQREYEIEKTLEDLGVIVFYVADNFENNAFGNFAKNLMRAMAQYQPESTAENVMRTNIDKAKENKFRGARVPYGYEIVGELYVINEDEACAVRKMYESVIAGSTIAEVIQQLTDEGFLTRSKEVFSDSTIRRILTSEKYKGTFIYNKDGGKKGKYSALIPTFEEIKNEGGIPAIIDDETFEKVQGILSKAKHKTSTKAKGPYLLTGLLKCNECGKLMHGYATWGRNHTRYTNYTCYSSKEESTSCKTTIRQEYIERATAELISNVVNAMLKETDVKAFALVQMRNDINKEINVLQASIKVNNREIENYLASLGRVNSQSKIDRINNHIDILENAIDVATKQIETLKEQSKIANNFVKRIQKGDIAMSADDILEDTTLFKTLINMIVEEIVVSKDKITFNLKDFK